MRRMGNLHGKNHYFTELLCAALSFGAQHCLRRLLSELANCYVNTYTLLGRTDRRRYCRRYHLYHG